MVEHKNGNVNLIYNILFVVTQTLDDSAKTQNYIKPVYKTGHKIITISPKTGNAALQVGSTPAIPAQIPIIVPLNGL